MKKLNEEYMLRYCVVNKKECCYLVNENCNNDNECVKGDKYSKLEEPVAEPRPCITCKYNKTYRLKGKVKCEEDCVDYDLYKERKFKSEKVNPKLNCDVICIEAVGEFELNKIYKVKDGCIVNEEGKEIYPDAETMYCINDLNEAFESKFEKYEYTCKGCVYDGDNGWGCANEQSCVDHDCYTKVELKLDTTAKDYVKQINLYKAALKSTPKDMVHKVSHYNSGDIEVIDILEQAIKDLNGLEGGYIFTILRYILRWKFKGGIEDLKKAYEYLGRFINILDKGEHKW
jgi:hypothetical protein